MPKVIKWFLIRALLLFLVWSLVYHFVLLPKRFPDKLFTNITANQTKLYLSIIYNTNDFHISDESNVAPKKTIFYKNKRIVGIADGCNGLEIYVLYISFLLCFPTNFKRLTIFSLIGIVSIFFANNLRCTIIGVLNFNSSLLTDVAHHYVFKLFMYGLLFFLWIKYTDKPTLNEH